MIELILLCEVAVARLKPRLSLRCREEFLPPFRKSQMPIMPILLAVMFGKIVLAIYGSKGRVHQQMAVFQALNVFHVNAMIANPPIIVVPVDAGFFCVENRPGELS